MNLITSLIKELRHGLKLTMKLSDKYCCDGEGNYKLPTSLVMVRNK